MEHLTIEISGGRAEYSFKVYPYYLSLPVCREVEMFAIPCDVFGKISLSSDALFVIFSIDEGVVGSIY